MDVFFKGLAQPVEVKSSEKNEIIDEACEEALLEAFAKK
jgi:hypothetical protein